MLETGEYIDKGFKPNLFDGIGLPFRRELSRLGFANSMPHTAPTLEHGSRAAVWASAMVRYKNDLSFVPILAVVTRSGDELNSESAIWYANTIDPKLLSEESEVLRARELLNCAEFGAYSLYDTVKFLTTELFGPGPCY